MLVVNPGSIIKMLQPLNVLCRQQELKSCALSSVGRMDEKWQFNSHRVRAAFAEVAE